MVQASVSHKHEQTGAAGEGGAVIATRTEAIDFLTHITTQAGCDPKAALGFLFKRSVPQTLPRRRSSVAKPPKKYERGEKSWRELIRDVLAATDTPMTSGEISLAVAQLRGAEVGTARDLRFVERCVGSTLSRYRNEMVGANDRLVSIGEATRNRKYALETVDAA